MRNGVQEQDAAAQKKAAQKKAKKKRQAEKRAMAEEASALRLSSQQNPDSKAQVEQDGSAMPQMNGDVALDTAKGNGSADAKGSEVGGEKPSSDSMAGGVETVDFGDSAGIGVQANAKSGRRNRGSRRNKNTGAARQQQQQQQQQQQKRSGSSSEGGSAAEGGASPAQQMAREQLAAMFGDRPER
jgi:hypothetical protein